MPIASMNGSGDAPKRQFAAGSAPQRLLLNCVPRPRRDETVAAFAEPGAMIDMRDREEGFERKFAHDEELRFKATARPGHSAHEDHLSAGTAGPHEPPASWAVFLCASAPFQAHAGPILAAHGA